MYEFLPTLRELVEIRNYWNTFYNCEFNIPFEQLTIENKIKVLTDLVRQSIYVEDLPNPITELDNLVGDAFTASLILKRYITDLIDVKKVELIAVRNNFYDDEDIISTFGILVTTFSDEQICAFPEPNIGYLKGEVIKYPFDNFSKIEIIDDEMGKKINEFRMFQYNNAGCIPILNIPKRYIQYFLGKKYCYMPNGTLYDRLHEWRLGLNSTNEKQLGHKEKQRISQCILGEYIKIDEGFDKKLLIKDSPIKITSINPRFFYENNLNLFLVKPSGRRIGREEEILNLFESNANSCSNEFAFNMGEPSDFAGLDRVMLFHPCAEEFRQSMYGESSIYLTEKTAVELGEIKKLIRRDFNDYYNKRVSWYDGDIVSFDPKIYNLVHTADDFCETAMHFMCMFPEYQQFTRYNYPNNKLKTRKLKKS